MSEAADRDRRMRDAGAPRDGGLDVFDRSVDVCTALGALRDPAIADSSQRFFKTGPGEYGEGDRFLGIRVPVLRRLARMHRTLPLGDVAEHLRSVWHEERLLAEHLVGAYVGPDDLTLLERLADSCSVWERRIAILATFHWTKQGTCVPALRIAERLLDDPHDLIHKAVGWMVREVGKRDPRRFEGFLAERYRRMPRTMLRYTVERLPEARRHRYLRGEA